MVLETWATEFSIGNHQQMFITQDNPVQRRPKIDYFSNEAVQNMIPIVSHISSNGYYGYCATPAMPPCNSVDNGIDKPSIEDDEKIQMDIQMDIQMVLQPPDDQVNHKLPCSVERRKRCQKFMHDDQAIAMKRCRNQAEIGEDRSIVRAHNTSPLHQSTFPVAPAEEVFFTASSTPPNNATRNEATNGTTMTATSATKEVVANGYMDIKGSSITLANHLSSKNIDDSDSAVDMERLFWHTHGSMLWRCENR